MSLARDDPGTGAPVPGRITIVVPSYNQAEYLDEALGSIVAQEYADVEIIVMDGGSTDGSVEVIERYAQKIDYWQSKPDGGQSQAIADGFQMSTGSILGWLNSDDRLVPGALGKVAEAFAESRARWIYGDTEVIDTSSELVEIRRTVQADIVDLVNLNLYLPQESTFFSRSLYFESGGINVGLHYAMDYDLWLKFADLAAPVHVPSTFGSFRYRPGQKSDDAAGYRAEELKVKEAYARHALSRHLRLQRLLRLKSATLRRRVRNDGIMPIARKQVRTLRGDGPKLGASRPLAGMLVVGVPGLLAGLACALMRAFSRQNSPGRSSYPRSDRKR